MGSSTFANSLQCAHLTAIFHSMKCEVDLRDWLLLLEGPNSIVYLNSVLNPRWERVSLRLAVHGRDSKNENECLSVPPSSSRTDRGCEGEDLEIRDFICGGKRELLSTRATAAALGQRRNRR